MRILFIAMIATLAFVASQPRAFGQNPGAPAAAATAKASAPIDITGYWVAFVTEDWRFRMITPRKGDYQPVPMTPEARKVADAWDPAADQASGNQCKSYGAGALMGLAARFHITWQGDNTLRVESDAGTQTRLFRFDGPASQGERTWQGNSSAQWEKPSSLKVVTNNLRSGYL